MNSANEPIKSVVPPARILVVDDNDLVAKTIKGIADITPDPMNSNRGTERGHAMLEESLREFGAGRSILLDKHGVVICGNKTLESAANIGLDDVLVVQTDGHTLVAVQRTDLDLEKDSKAKRLAIADNRIGELDLSWDPSILAQLQAEEAGLLEGLFRDDELARLLQSAECVTDPMQEWRGMPEFEQEDQLGYQLTVHFKTLQDKQEFAGVIGQSLTEKTRYIWFPEQQSRDVKSYQCKDES